MRVPRSNFTNKLHTWLVLSFLLIFIAVLVVPIELSRMSVHAQNNNAVPQQPYQTFDTRQTAQLNELYGKWQSGEQFAEEEKLILQRWGLGLPISELEGRVVISRVLFERYVANQELTLEEEGLLSEFESYRRAAGRLIEDERVKIKQERLAQQEASPSQSSPSLVEAVPANDNCSGAIGITDTGSYPIATATVDAVSATTTGDPLFSCATVDDTIWYTFIPSQTATYTISTCTAGTGSSDTVLGVFTASGVCSGFTQVAGGCSDTDFSCASNTESSTVNPLLAAGVTYYIIAGRSNFLPASPPSVPIQLSISRPPSPVNDTCAGATPLALDIPLAGTTFAANKDYQLSGTSCFTGIGQTPVVADGRDVVYSFTPPATDDYSFRVTGLKNTNSDLVLYVTTSCPAPSTITCNNSSGPAIVAANRSFGTTSEEVMCVPLVGGQTYYLVVDEQQQSDGSAFTVEVNQCRREVEPNDLPTTAGTGAEGSIGSGTDVDFYQLGTPAAGSRVFALLDGVAANNTDFDMRVTTSTNTLEYDDKEADSQFGSQTPVIAGTPLTGVASYLRINHKSGTLASEPYRLYRQVQPAGNTALAACPTITTSATAETESNNTAASADALPNNCQLPKICYYASGSIGSADADYFSFNATAGNLIFLAVDGNPCRDGTVSAFNPALELRDSLDAQLIRVNDTNSGLTCPAATSICTAQAGLTATAPNSAAEALVYRARTTGTYYARVSQGASSTGNYLLSISLDQTVIPVQPALSISDVSQAEGNSGTTSFTFTVGLSAASSQTVTVQYVTANGTATAGPDYQSTSGTLTFNPGQTSKLVTVLVNGDTTLETNETFLVNLAVPTNATFADTQGVGTIVNDDAQPTISINDISQGEGNSGTTSFTFAVGLSAASSQTVTVNYATANGTATAGSDYQSATGTVTFNPGETSKPVTVLVNGDTLNEANETFLVNLTVPTNATISDNQGVGTITNDDAVPALSINDVGVTEGNSGTVNAGFTVSLSAATGQTVTVQYATANGTATAGSDYQSATGTLTFNAGETTKPITVLVNGDTTFETNETFLVNLTVPTNATIADSQGVGTILNDDAVPSLSINDVTMNEGNSGTTSFTFTVGLSAASSQTVTVNYATANGTATAGSDYQSASGTLTFNAGETSKPVVVLVNGDALNEPNETFLVNLTVPTNATISDNQGLGTITNDDPVPSLSINDVGVTEGNSGTVSAGFTVSLSAASGQTVTVQYATADGTATAGSDYQSASGTVTFNAGETSKPVTVLVNGDTTFETNETFLVNLTVPTNATIADNQGVGTISNDDAQPTISSNDISQGEGNSGTTSFTFAVGLSAASSQTVTVNYATANGTATAGSDYQSATGTVTFNPGETSKPVTVLVNGDTLNEANETFLVNLTVPTNATISDNQGVGTITNDDAVPALSINDVGVTEGNSGTVSANFTVSLSAVSGQTVTVQYATADGTAVAGTDYQATGGTLTFNAGETTKPVTVLVNGDNVNELNETFVVNLTNPGNATIADNQGVGTIVNDDAQPTISINDVSQAEGNSGTTSFTFTVSLSAVSSQTVTVNFATANGTASAGNDYQSASGTVTFNAGEMSKPITVLVNGDVLNEANETFFVNLTVPTNTTINDGQGLGTITNDDGVPSLSINDVGVTEGNSGTVSAGFTVSLSAASGQTVTVQYATANGTAIAGSDYQSASGTLTFNAGETSKPVTVLVNGDNVNEPNETFLVNLTVPTNASISDNQGIGTILNDDGAPTLSINDISQGEGNSGTTSFTFTVTLSPASGQTVTVNYATADATATAGSDYQSTSGTLTFNAGETSKPVTVLVNGDTLNEANETFLVNLTVPTNATIIDNQGVGTVTNDDAAPALSINDVGVTEGNSGTVSAGFTVNLSAVSGQTVTVQYATADGTATAGSDYQSASGTLTFNPGETSKPVAVLVNGDTTFEINETFLVNLTVPTNATIADNQGIGTILNDDGVPTLSINDISQGEGNSGTTSFTFTVGLSATSSQTVTVNYATANGTATAGSDYQSATGTVTFNAGETTKPVTVLVNGDLLNEANETFFVNLTLPTNATTSDGQGLGTITNDDAVPALSINDAGVTEGNSGTVSAGFTVSLSAASGQTVTVQYATADGTATVGSDYQSTSGTLIFNPGETSKPITVLVNGDTAFEANETFLVNLTVPTNATIGDGQGVGTIANDDVQPTISINDISQGEGNSGTTSFTFTVSLSAASSQTVTVNYATADGTATAGSDYQSASGTVTFNPGETTKPVTVLVNGDLVNEANETFFVNLSNAGNATISDSQGLGTITNDEGMPSLSINDVGVTEGNSGTVSANFTVSLSAASGQTVTVQYATADGTATAGSDYQSASGTLTFNAGETSKPIMVLVNGDTTFESNETFLVNLTVPTNAAIGDGQGVGTIANDDAQPTISINDISQGEGNSGTTSFTFAVGLSAASSQTVTVNYATANGTATAGSDYQSATGTVTFNPGQTSKPLTVLVNGDTVNEANETFLVNLTVPTNATISDNQGVGTITNDDAVPSLSINDVGVAEGNSGTVSANITVSLSAASGQTVTVQYATADGTATAGSDYQSASGTLTFNAGETSKPVTVLVNGDNVNEANETFLVNLTVPTNATIADNQGIGTILNDDGASTLSINDISQGEGNSGTTSFPFTVNLLPASDQTVTVAYATANGTATAGSDYQSTSGTLTFNAGETSKPVMVLVNGETLNEANETFLVNLIVPTNATISDNQGVGTITNDDAVPALSISDVGVTEGNSGTVSANFTVRLSAVSGQTVTVQYATANGTATAGSDYQSASGTLTFNPGETSKPLTVLVNGDTAFEADETFLVNLTVPTNATIADNQGVGTIANDDAQPPANAVQFTATTASVTETANATTKVDLVVTRGGDSSGPATVDYASADGTASERSDYLAALGTLRFAAGETAKSISVFIVDDVFGESAETFNVVLSNPVGVALGAPSSVTVTINSNESVNGLNPVKDASFNSDFFVRQHYVDFFNREADPGGLAFWKNQIDECTTQECKEVRRINVSAAFFISIEFQQTGYLVYKANQASFNSGEFLRLREFLPDLQEIGRGVVIGQPGADAQLEANKQKFFLAFVQRAKFVDPAAFPTTMTAAQFVDKLNANTFDPLNPGAGALTQTERDALVGQLSAGPASPTLRAQVLRSVAENVLFSARQFNKAFVLMQYFGYLRRNPNDPPEIGLDFAGYNFWLGKLNQFNGNFINAEMVKAFILSGEYQQRFGP
jgi:ribosomal protein L35AE/L33A